MASAPTRHAWRALQWIVGATIIVFAARTVVREWDGVQAVAWQARPLHVLLSAVCVWLMYALLVQAWRVMLAGWGEQIELLPAARIWTISSLGKYIPGKVWAIAGMALMAQRAGVRPWAATASAIVLQALAVGTGAAVVGLSGAGALEAEYPWMRLALPALVAVSTVGLALLLWPSFVRRLLSLARVQGPTAVTPGAAPILMGAAANLVAWCGYGVAFWLLGHGLFDVPGLTIRLAVTTFAASYVAGLLFLLAPGGLVVREGFVVLMLSSAVGAPNALALAAASRILLTVTEFGAAAPFLLLRRERIGAES